MSVKPPKRKHFQIQNGFSLSKQIEEYKEAKKVNLFTQSNLIKCQHPEKKKKKRRSVPDKQIRKGKRIVKQIDVDQQATGIYFQEEIIVGILNRLPVRSLLRFKCVSKNWEALISDPGFKMKHRSSDSNSEKLLIVQRSFTQGGLSKFKFYSSSLSIFEDVQELDSPLTYYVAHYELFSSFDGLVLLKADRRLLLWNPSTRESALLPHSDLNVLYSSFGLGYDATSDCYKILQLNLGLQKQSIEILTLKSGASWRKICNHPTAVSPRTGCKMEIHLLPSRIVPMDPLVCVHGTFHWLGEFLLRGKYYVVSFGISNEVFGDVPLLDEMCAGFSRVPDIGLSLLDGMLCFHMTTNYFSLGTFKLWGMKEYGVKESWTILFTIQLNDLVIAKPRYRFLDGDVLLYSGGELSFKPPRTFSFRTTKGKFGFWPQRGPFNKGIVYRESLISPKLVI